MVKPARGCLLDKGIRNKVPKINSKFYECIKSRHPLKGRCFNIYVFLPTIYMMMKQLSYASPTTNRHTQNDQNVYVNAVPTPPMKPHRFAPAKYRICIKQRLEELTEQSLYQN